MAKKHSKESHKLLNVKLFCTTCQKDFKNPQELRMHLFRDHPDVYERKIESENAGDGFKAQYMVAKNKFSLYLYHEQYQDVLKQYELMIDAHLKFIDTMEQNGLFENFSPNDIIKTSVGLFKADYMEKVFYEGLPDEFKANFNYVDEISHFQLVDDAKQKALILMEEFIMDEITSDHHGDGAIEYLKKEFKKIKNQFAISLKYNEYF